MAGARFDGLDIEILRSRKSEKWHAYSADILPAWVAEMDFPIAAPIQQALKRALDSWDVGYPIAAGNTGIREAFADRMEERFGWSVNPRQIEVLSEVVQGLYLAIGAFTSPGESVVVQPPIYPPFLLGVEESGRRLVENRLVQQQGGWEIDFDALAESIEIDLPPSRLLDQWVLQLG